MLRRSLELALIVIGAVACSTAPTLYPAHPLTDEIVKARKGHDGNLTNRTCGAYDDKTDACTQVAIHDYPLSDATFRDTANRLNFLCNLGGKRYKICKDKPGFCRIGYTQSCFLFICNSTEVELDYIPATNNQFLLDSNARCANKTEYNLWDWGAISP